MTDRQIVQDILRKELSAYLDSKYSDDAKDKCKAMMNSPHFRQMMGNKNSVVINDFVVDLMIGVSQGIYLDLREETIDSVIKDWDSIIGDLLSDSEMKSLKDFMISDVGKKLMRNLDLYGESFTVGVTKLAMSTMIAWTSPEVGKAIGNFIDQLEEQE